MTYGELFNSFHKLKGYAHTAYNLNTGEVVANIHADRVIDAALHWQKESQNAILFTNKHGVIIVWNPDEKIFYEEVK